jgi:hypothetical protein
VRRLLAAILVTGSAFCASAPRSRPAADLQHLARLYEDGRCFELRDALVRFKDARSPDLEFFRGAVDQVFNRLGAAVPRLRRYLAAGTGRPGRLGRDAGLLLADAYWKLGRYDDAAGALRDVLARWGPLLDDGERAGVLAQQALCAALSGVPPQSFEQARDAVLRMTKRTIPVRAGGRDIFLGYDTGADLSVLVRSAADELGLPVYGPAIEIRTVTGRSIGGRIAVVPELRLGPVVVRNAVFVILPDELLPPVKVSPGVLRRGLLGAPLLLGLREFTETKEGDLVIPAAPRRRSVENMFLSGSMPVVEAFHRRARLGLCLDTGAAATVLFPPFYRRYRGEIDSRSSLRQITLGGIGSTRTVPARIIDEFAFRTGGLALALPKVMVQTLVTLPHTRYFHGTLGIDLLTSCRRMTLNFDSMSFILE